MPGAHQARHKQWIHEAIVAIAMIAAVTAAGSCRREDERSASNSSSRLLRVGVAQLSATNPMFGIRQLAQLEVVEGIARIGEKDGRMLPVLAESWTLSPDGRSLSIKLRAGVKFHDGSLLDAEAVAKALPDALRPLMGRVYDDIDHVRPSSADTVDIGMREPSPFLLESLEVPIQKPGGTLIGTGPFKIVPNSTSEMRANDDYYLGRPIIDTIEVGTYPSVRAAWAEMLRNRLDFLYEVGPDALDSMKNSSTVSTFTFNRRYQHAVVFNTNSSALHFADVRRALNMAVERPALVRSALNDYGVPSTGVIWPQYWALEANAPKFDFDPKRAAEMLGSAQKTRTHFTCLVSPDSLDERIALEVKRQLAAVGVDMAVEEASRDEIVRRAAAGQYEAAVTELIGGPTLLRAYSVWHSRGPLNWGKFGNPTIDRALDRVRYAKSESEYRTAIAGVQTAFLEDPPAILLAWSVRARAVSNGFNVVVEGSRDIMATVRLWKPVADKRRASRN